MWPATSPMPVRSWTSLRRNGTHTTGAGATASANPARWACSRLAEADIAVQALVVNRVHPDFGVRTTEAAASATASRAATLAGTVVGGLYRNLADFQAVASREHAHLAGLADAVAPAPVVWVPFLRSDVHDLAGLGEVAGHVFARAADAGGG